MQSNCSREEVTYAGFWARLAAYIIDSIIVFFGLLIVRLFLAGIMSLLKGTVLDGNILFQYTLKDIVLYVCQAVYFILFTYNTGTTPGKRLMNLRVISAEEERLTFFDVLYRETIGRFLCSASIGIGYIMAGVDKEKRGIHDMLSDTRVIYAKKVKVYAACAPQRETPPVQRETMPVQRETMPVQRETPPVQRETPPVQKETMPVQMEKTHAQGQEPAQYKEGAYHMVHPEEEQEERNS